MQAHDLSYDRAVENNHLPDLATMPSATGEPSSSPIHSENDRDPESKNPENGENVKENSKRSKIVEETSKNNGDSNVVVRRERPSRACTQRAVQRMQQAAAAEAALAAADKKRKASRRRERASRLVKEEEEEEEHSEDDESGDEEGEEEEDGGPSSSSRQPYSKVITPLVGEPEASQLPRWNIRSMWQLASILHFFNVFRPLLNIKVELSAEEFETALIMPNNTLGDIHMPLLKAIPPITRIALGQKTWVTVLCRKLRDWWHWVAEGDLPIVASHGAEFDAYNALDPGVRVVILKALCDIRVEQEDIRNYIDDSVKRGVHLSLFRKERVGGDSHGISYWFEDDPDFGHRLYREIRKVEVKRGKGKTVPPIPNSSYQWETVATNFDEFQDVSEKLFSSKNRTEASLGKKLKKDMLPEIEKVHKRKEKLLKKQHRQALLLDSMIHVDGLGAGRSLRDRKKVTYTFDDYDRSINEAIKETKKAQPSFDPTFRRDFMRHENATNGRWGGPSQYTRRSTFSRQSSKSPEYDDYGGNDKAETLDRGNRRRQRPDRYSVRDFVEAVSDNEADFDSDEDIVGEVVYDDEYLRQKRRKISSSSEGDEEYRWDDENPEDEEEEEENDSSTASEGSEASERPRRFKKFSGRSRRETKLRSVDEIQSGLRRSRRATRNRMNYSYYDLSDSDTELMKSQKITGSEEQSNESDNADFSMASQESDGNDETREDENRELETDQTVEEDPEVKKKEEEQPTERSSSPGQNEVEGVRKRRFLDLNQLAPGSGFDDGPNSMKDEDTDDF